MKLMIIGHARHGKDTVCDILARDFGLKHESSSHFCAERAVRPWLAAKGITYPTFEAMYADRVNHRKDWYDAITQYNLPDRTRLARELYELYDIYVGIRNGDELAALQAAGVVQYTMWVDASKRLPPEPESSMTIGPHCADAVIDNNGPLYALQPKVHTAYWAMKMRLAS